jgi:ABC-type multidrug transport system fused ATPase/permease subunit
MIKKFSKRELLSFVFYCVLCLLAGAILTNFIDMQFTTSVISETRFVEIAKICIQIGGVLIGFMGVSIFYYEKMIAESSTAYMKELAEQLRSLKQIGADDSNIEKIRAMDRMIVSSRNKVNRLTLIFSFFTFGLLLFAVLIGLFAMVTLDVSLLKNTIGSLIVGIVLMIYTLLTYDKDLKKLDEQRFDILSSIRI